MFSLLRQSVLILIVLSMVTGVVYPAAVTILAQVIFPNQANGSLIERDGKVVGSGLVGQQFDDPKYFWSRPSATTPAYNGGASTGSNFGPTNPAQLTAVKDRMKALRDAHPDQTGPVPIDLVTASGSGLDPDISPAAAEYQVNRVAKTRSIDAQAVRELVQKHTASRQFGLVGEPRVNVLKLNLALDSLRKNGR
jgi:K+-transporting ATPase ATPase C chain